jgi:hypothetical protein
MRDLNLRKQLKTFGKGLLRGAAAVATAGASEGGRIGEKIYETFQSYNEKPKVGNLPSVVQAGPKKPSTNVRATGEKMQAAKKLEKLPATSTNAKPAGIQTVKTKTSSPEISKAKPTVKKKASSKKVKTKVKTNKRGMVKIKTKIK